MYQIVKNCIKILVPRKILSMLRYYRYPKTKTIIKYFLRLKRDEQSKEIIEIINYLKKYGFSVFPYNYTRKYSYNHIKTFYDPECQMSYVIHEGKRMYFPNGWKTHKI
jgi:hypothetical protein